MSSFENVTNQPRSEISYLSTTQEYSLKCRDVEILEDSSFLQQCTKNEYSIKNCYEENLEAALYLIKQSRFDLKLQRYPNTLNYIRKLIDDPNTPDAFHVVDVGRIVERFSLWKINFPEVSAYYAVKANPDPIILETLAYLGLGFDCASENEMKFVLSRGVSPDKIIFSNTRKFNSAIIFAKQNGVKKITFDSNDELMKMIEIFPDAEYILRIKTDDSDSIVKLSTKFGCTLNKALELIKICNYLNVNLIGINFHVGSNCSNAESFKKAISDCAFLFKEAQENYGMKFSFLDLGGGWPGTNDKLFKEMTQVVKQSIMLYFDSSVKVIAEPGRFFSSPVVTLVTKIIGVDEYKREISDDSGEKKVEECRSYFLSDGVFQSFIGSIYFNHDTEILKSEGLNFMPLTNRTNFGSLNLFSSILWTFLRLW
jgi:ornithine decarboxylase